MLKRKPPSSKSGMNHSSNGTQDLTLNYSSGPSESAPSMLLQLQHQHHKEHHSTSETQGHVKFQLKTSLLGAKRYANNAKCGGPSPLPSPSPNVSSFLSASNGGHITSSSQRTSAPGSTSKNKTLVKLNYHHQTSPQHSATTSNMQNSLGRCRSASTIRKKLLHAVEQDNATLISSSKFSTACTQSDQITSSNSTATRQPNSAASNAAAMANVLSVPGLPAAYRATIRPSSAAYTIVSGTVQETRTIGQKQEQELDKRLSGLENINFPDDQSAMNARLNAVLSTMDDVIQHDKAFANVLFRIRHEFESFMKARGNTQSAQAEALLEQDLSVQHERNLFSNGCRCTCHEESNNSHEEVLGLRQENKILNKNITAMGTQLDMLTLAQSSMYIERDVTQENEEEEKEEEDDDDTDGEGHELEDILLCNPNDEDVSSNSLYEENESQGGMTSAHVHIPQLNLSSLLPYNEAEEEDGDEDQHQEHYQEYDQEQQGEYDYEDDQYSHN